MKGKVLIFGIGGFVGQYLAKEFQDEDYMVYGSDVIHPITLTEGIVFSKADLLKKEEIFELITTVQPDMIVNLAAISSVGDSWIIPQTTIMVNVIGTLNIMEAARKQAKVPKILFIGSSEEYQALHQPIAEDTPLDSNNPYGISKITQESFAKLYRTQYDMKIYYVRPFNHTGIGQKDSFVLPSFCKQVAEIEKSGKSGVIKVGNLSAKRDFSHVKDIVRAYRLILESNDCSKSYNVGSGIAYGLDEILNYVINLSSQNIDVEQDLARFRPVDTPVICCDNSRIRTELGWIPEYSVFDALKEMYDYYRNL